ncbi:transcriptional regulator [Vibrio diazotrophicus]|uniref:Transcriptional regulator n=1 Tax=Vibrio diazotrophicus TaxID=685 RepID=A0A2J8I8M3_VIBDI|nr:MULTISPECIES: PLP-dependent aminotransferase family protein [Vibrio]MCF7361986.1 PLP-dependent aminotransferase family protein [Vibrio sp. A1-b2]PNI06863.1 transcriptional regulator [Vibrio diazotrophicus]
MQKYKQLAEKIIEDIQSTKLKHGDRMLSLRLFAKQHGVSVSTAVSCYQDLEQRGWLEARPQSGFFICSQTPVVATPSWQRFATQLATNVRPRIKPQVKSGPLGIACIELDVTAQRALDKSFRRVMTQSPSRLTQYPNKQGEPVLRDALSSHFSQLGFALRPDELVITHGCMDAVKTALQICVKAGDTVAVSSPCFNGLLELLANLGLKIIEIPSVEDGIDLDALERLFQNKQAQAGLFCTTHMNPQGITMSAKQKKRLSLLASQYQIPVIEDDVYFELNHSDKLHLPTAYYDESGYVIWCGSFSKTLSPSYRLGWCRPGKFVAKYTQQYEGVPTLIQTAIADFIQTGAYSRHLKRTRQQLAINKQDYTRFLVQHLPQNSRITQPDGGLVLWLQVAGLSSDKLNVEAIKSNMDIRVGSVFTESQRYDDCVRINIGFALNNEIERLLSKLIELINNCLPQDSLQVAMLETEQLAATSKQQ